MGGKAKGRPGEFALIESLFAPLARSYPLAFDLKDDAALIRPRLGVDLVVTKDVIVEGVHFLAEDPAPSIAKKLLRVNLSDLAAKGAKPLGFLLGLVLPAAKDMRWLEGFAAGLAEDSRAFDIALLGGDTVATPGPLTLSLTAIGEVPEGRAILRSGGRSGDLVFVTGTIGDGALGLRAAKGEDLKCSAGESAYLAGRYRTPEPRLSVGRRLLGLASAAIDVSDGLVADLGHLCETSGVGASIRAFDAPLSKAARAVLSADAAMLNDILTGGDDYEILFTAAASAKGDIAEIARVTGVAVSAIGELTARGGVVVADGEGQAMEIARKGFSHF